MKREPHSRLDIGLGGKGRESIPVDVFLEEGGRGRNPELGFFRHTRTVWHEGSDRVFQQPGCPRDTLGYARACCHEGLRCRMARGMLQNSECVQDECRQLYFSLQRFINL